MVEAVQHHARNAGLETPRCGMAHHVNRRRRLEFRAIFFGAGRRLSLFEKRLYFVIGVVVQVGVLRVSAVLNNFATNDPKFCKNMPERWSEAFGCETIPPRTKRRLYWTAIACLNAFMFANWMWGEKLRHALLGH